MFLRFSFHLFKHEVTNFLIWNNNNNKKKSYLIFDLWYHHNALQIWYLEFVWPLKKPTAFTVEIIIIVNGTT